MIHLKKVEPITEPVTLEEMRLHLGITRADDTSRDFIISNRITSARQWAEDYTNRSFITQTYGAYDDDFPGVPKFTVAGITAPVNREIRLRVKLQSITSIKYLDSNGFLQTLSPTKYLVDSVQGRVVPSYGNDWPAVRSQPNAVEIEYLCGYGDATAVPEAIKDAIRFTIGQWEVFQSSMEGIMRPFTIPNAAKQLLDNYIDLRDAF